MGASLLAIAVYQSPPAWMGDLHREQARSHKSSAHQTHEVAKAISKRPNSLKLWPSRSNVFH
ncbi:hypothetical protein FGE05_12445 [Pseudomonas sp. ICMP22404]|nr:hypothetical protein FGE05_12445 [Pseudomonas sp. ICMP22404]